MKFCQEGWIRYQAKEGLVTSSKPKPVKKDSTKIKDEKKLYIELLDRLVRIYLLQVQNKCFTCGYTPEDRRELQVGHFIKRTQLSVRWHLLTNTNLQCVKCNCELHGNLEVYEAKLRKQDGDRAVDVLIDYGNSVKKISKEDMLNQIDFLRQLIKNYKQ